MHSYRNSLINIHNDPVLAHMRKVAYTPIELKPEPVGTAYLDAQAKRERKQNLALKNAGARQA